MFWGSQRSYLFQLVEFQCQLPVFGFIVDVIRQHTVTIVWRVEVRRSLWCWGCTQWVHASVIFIGVQLTSALAGVFVLICLFADLVLSSMRMFRYGWWIMCLHLLCLALGGRPRTVNSWRWEVCDIEVEYVNRQNQLPLNYVSVDVWLWISYAAVLLRNLHLL